MALSKFAFFEGQIVPYAEAKVGVLTHALNYGTGAFGGLRGYWNPDQQQLYLFRPLDHYKRLLNSAKMLCMEFDHTPESLTEITIELLRKEGFQQDVYIRPLVYKADEGIGVKLHDVRDALITFGTDATHGYERTHLSSLSSIAELLFVYAFSPPIGMPQPCRAATAPATT